MDSNHSLNIPLFESYCEQNNIDGRSIDCEIGTFPFNLTVASTPISLMKGYQNEENPPPNNEGMLFVYPKPAELSFWMKNVSFPLDIMFFDSDKNLVEYATMDENSYPNTYRSSVPCQYAIETRAGWCKENISDINKLKLTF
jgi:uncharacterized membrane protein (UPF0127 family)